MLQPIAFARRNPSIAQRQYRNIERETLGILQKLETFEVHAIADSKPLVAIRGKDVATLSHA